MNVYDFDDTIYDGDSSIDFFKFFIKKDPSVISYAPSIAKIMKDYRATAIRFDDMIDKYGVVVENYVKEKKPDIPALFEEFWDLHDHKIKPFYKHIQKEDDLIITASPTISMDILCPRVGIKHWLGTEFDEKTGKFIRGCFRETKIDFFREAYPEGVIDDFYTDSLNDEFLFPYAKRVFWVKGHKITQIK
ncbi:MAG: haloacid dehalogenase-like hydrolase [Clostridia bacterium]|nr:haloacid dehalogenase-like hydrolase [Clostridia bacterium]MBR2078920.1 haloacid dehalogenase-like hydrolase [Clostridia bacterium]MBR2418520.1 haloacid dehalogenase-like hydrolase [Clostridia bacterium]